MVSLLCGLFHLSKLSWWTLSSVFVILHISEATGLLFLASFFHLPVPPILFSSLTEHFQDPLGESWTASILLRLTCPTMMPNSCLLRGLPALRPWNLSRDSARVWTKLWTSVLASPHAPKHKPIRSQNSSSLCSTGPFSSLPCFCIAWSTFLAFLMYSICNPFALFSVPRHLPDATGLYHVSQQLMTFSYASR